MFMADMVIIDGIDVTSWISISGKGYVNDKPFILAISIWEGNKFWKLIESKIMISIYKWRIKY